MCFWEVSISTLGCCHGCIHNLSSVFRDCCWLCGRLRDYSFVETGLFGFLHGVYSAVGFLGAFQYLALLSDR